MLPRKRLCDVGAANVPAADLVWVVERSLRSGRNRTSSCHARSGHHRQSRTDFSVLLKKGKHDGPMTPFELRQAAREKVHAVPVDF
jgi:hypothetical protein